MNLTYYLGINVNAQQNKAIAMLPSPIAVMNLPATSQYHEVAVAPSLLLKLVITALVKRDLHCTPQSSAWIQRELCFPISSDPQSQLFQ